MHALYVYDGTEAALCYWKGAHRSPLCAAALRCKSGTCSKSDMCAPSSALGEFLIHLPNT